MAFAAGEPVSDQPNHHLAVRMAVIAGICFNVVIGTVMGSFSVMLASAEQRLGLSEPQAVVGILLAVFGSALLAPFVGVLIARFSLRLLMMTGALLTTVGFLLLAYTNSPLVYFLVYGLCFGPALILAGSVGPNTLVTRWFSRHRGLAVGLVNLAIVIAIMPSALNALIERSGAQVGYLMLAGLCGLIMLPVTFFVVDYPPGAQRPTASTQERRTADGSLTMGEMLKRSRFWGLCLAAGASMTSSVLLGSLLVPIGVSWGFTRGESALLASIMSTVGILGGLLFGWVSDSIGGVRTLVVVCLNCAVLWAVLLMHPPFALTAVVIGLIGLHGAAPMPALAHGLSDSFGSASYSRGMGLNTFIGLPFMACAMLGAPMVFKMTGSFSQAVAIMAGYFLLTGLFALVAARKPAPAAPPVPATT